MWDLLLSDYLFILVYYTAGKKEVFLLQLQGLYRSWFFAYCFEGMAETLSMDKEKK